MPNKKPTKINLMAKQKGKVAQVIGPVIDVTFDLNDTSLPDIYDSLEITRENGDKLILECQQHIGEDTIRAISMESTCLLYTSPSPRDPT